MRSATPQLVSATYQPRFNLKEEAPAAGWRPFLRQGIQVAKRSVQLAREMTVWADMCQPAVDDGVRPASARETADARSCGAGGLNVLLGFLMVLRSSIAGAGGMGCIDQNK